MNELQALMGDSYKEGLTVEDITNFMKGKNFADLSTGGYVDVNKHNKELNDLKANYTSQLKTANDALQAKMTDDEKIAKAQQDKDAEIKRLMGLLQANNLTASKSIANGSLAEGLNLIGIKNDDNDFKTFIDNIVTEDNEKTDSIAKYVNKLMKDAYEKGKKDNTKDAMGNFGKQNSSSSKSSDDIGKLGKELAQSMANNKPKKNYFE